MTEIRNLGKAFPKKNSKFCNSDNCKKTAIYNYMFMKPKFCYKHKNEYMVNIKKRHILCLYHYLSHSQKTKCLECKIKKSTKCDECDITASYNFEKLRPLKCLKHRKKGMINIKRKQKLCEKQDISHSKKSRCRICKLDIDNYYDSTNYIKEKMYFKFRDDLTEKIKNKFKNHSYMVTFNNILNNSIDKRIIKFKMIMEERGYLGHIRELKMCYKFLKKSELNDVHNKYKELIKLKREIYFKFKESNYKSIDKYIEDEIDISIIKYNILKRKMNSINLKMKEIIEKKKKLILKNVKKILKKVK